jgi:hypothetical protein
VFIIVILADIIIQSDKCARPGMKRRERSVIQDQRRDFGVNVHKSRRKKVIADELEARTEMCF